MADFFYTKTLIGKTKVCVCECVGMHVLLVIQLKEAGKTSSIESFKDPRIRTGHPIIDLLDAIRPGKINYELVTNGDNEEASNIVWIQSQLL